VFRKSEDIFEDSKKQNKASEKNEKRQQKEQTKQIRWQEKQDELNAKAAKKAGQTLQKVQENMEKSKQSISVWKSARNVLLLLLSIISGFLFVVLISFLREKSTSIDVIDSLEKNWIFIIIVDIFLLSTYAYFFLKGKKSVFFGLISIIGLLGLFVTYFELHLFI